MSNRTIYNGETFAQRLKKYRNHNDLTQQQVADTLNIDRSTYSYYETGKTEPNMDTIIKLAKIFDVNVGTLLTGDADSGVADSNAAAKLDIIRMENLTKEEQLIITRYRIASKERRDRVKEILTPPSAVKTDR